MRDSPTELSLERPANAAPGTAAAPLHEPPGMNTYRLGVPGIAESVPLARRWLATVLASMREVPVPESVQERAAVAVSECVTNALQHSRSGGAGAMLWAQALLTPGTLHVRVEDLGGSTTPQVSPTGSDTEHGHGLVLVHALTDEWGRLPPDRPGVYFRLTWTPRPRPC